MSADRSLRKALLLGALAFSVAGSCVLNPQPEPPSKGASDRDASSSGGAAGAGGAGGTSMGTGGSSGAGGSGGGSGGSLSLDAAQDTPSTDDAAADALDDSDGDADDANDDAEADGGSALAD